MSLRRVHPVFTGGTQYQHSHTPPVLSGPDDDSARHEQVLQAIGSHSLRQHVGELILRRHVVDRDDAPRHILTDEVILKVDILGPSVVACVARQRDGTLIVLPHSRSSHLLVAQVLQHGSGP
ncbi:hypothetical protein ON010_g17922 [Phytophthora cinnamomi]|nr:hypothetical protein ON010_g17922 [Phytophthora cinnamomi]